MPASWRSAVRLLCLLAMVGGGIAAAAGAQDVGRAPQMATATQAERPPETERSARTSSARRARPASLRSLDPREHRVEDGTVLADLEGGETAILSLDPGLQQSMQNMLESYAVPYAAIVAMEPASGRVLAYVSHSSAEPDGPDLVRSVDAPAASVFKVITGAALLEAGVSPEERICYHGGASRLRADDLEPDPERDRQCATLSEAMGGSINAVFARLADEHLDARTLGRYASAFGFGEALPFDVPVAASPIDVPDERVERARAAAGFWHSHMSPLHAALIAATIANRGSMPRASIVDRVLDADGDITYEARPEQFRAVIGRRTAELLDRMMRRTVTHGTARRAFFDDHGRPFLPGIEVAGKTGTLSSERPYRGYTWWVGYAPADDPQIAVAALLVNTPEWRIKASYAAREALRYWLVTRPAEARRAERRAERESGATE
jgi:penicillin-binding protein A